MPPQRPPGRPSPAGPATRLSRRGRGPSARPFAGVALLATLGLAASACGGSNGAASYGPYPGSLPSASTLCPTLAEVDYYVPVSAKSAIVEQSTTAGVRSTVRCVYGDPRRAPRHAASVTMVLWPTATETRPSGVVITEIKHVGLAMISYRRGDLNSVVIHQGRVDVIVTSAVPRSALEGFAEEELSRIPEADRA
ncbi:MAG: hypothetical protein WAL35_06960 [Acidimicrobiales bacterium]